MRPFNLTGKLIEEMSNYNDYILEESKDKLLILKQAIEEDWSMEQLINNFPGELNIVIGDNSSGCNVANLRTKQVDEWSW